MWSNAIIEFDQSLFTLINGEWANAVLDYILVPIRNKYFWIPLYIFIITFTVLNFKKRSYWYLFFILLTFAVTDLASSKIIKESIKRARPCHEIGGMEDTRLLVPCGSGYSFTSSHATNHFGIAFFIIFTFGRKRRWVSLAFIIWAAMISYAQVYVGVHYPLDVICGTLLGICMAFLTAELYFFTMKKMEFLKNRV